MSTRAIKLKPEEITKADSRQPCPWSLETLKHPSNMTGIYATTRLLSSQVETNLFWYEGKLKDENPKRDATKVFAGLAAVTEMKDKGQWPGFIDLSNNELALHLRAAGRNIHNIVAIGLGSLLYSENEDYEDSLWQHMLVRRIFETAYTMNTANEARWRVFLEDCHYYENDRHYLDNRFLDQKHLNKRVKVEATNDGTGWTGTQKDSGDYIFMTFKPIDSIRQILAWYTWKDGDHREDWDDREEPNAIMPRAIICRYSTEILFPKITRERGTLAPNERREDDTDTRVDKWFSRYKEVHRFTVDDHRPFEGKMYLWILRPRDEWLLGCRTDD